MKHLGRKGRSRFQLGKSGVDFSSKDDKKPKGGCASGNCGSYDSANDEGVSGTSGKASGKTQKKKVDLREIPRAFMQRRKNSLLKKKGKIKSGRAVFGSYKRLGRVKKNLKRINKKLRKSKSKSANARRRHAGHAIF